MRDKSMCNKSLYHAVIGVGVVFVVLGIICTQAFGRQRAVYQQILEARVVDYVYQDGYRFKDLNKNSRLDAYEDWRLAIYQRVENLLGQMTLKEKAGMMLIDTMNAEWGGEIPETGVQYIKNEKMTRFVFRNTVTPDPDPTKGSWLKGSQITPYEAAQFMNLVQETAEATRLGIPVLFKSNARNHYTHDARPGINSAAGSFSEWPKEAGLAATRDMELIKDFAEIMASEWAAIGLRSMYGYMADLATEPRWNRNHETFTEDADLAADIITVLVENLQGKELNSHSVALTLKHFPGGGPQEGGADPHYAFGKNQVYASDNFDYHLKPFKAAIDTGVAAIMPYYGVPVDQGYGVTLEGENQSRDVGMAFSKGILTDLLRTELAFNGVVNSDTGIIGDCDTPITIGDGVSIAGCRSWGLEDKSIEEQLIISIEAGTDVLSGFHDNDQILKLIQSGKLSEKRVDESVKRLLTVQFGLGLFENPYVDPDRASYLLGNRAFQERADYAQRKSIVLLQNTNNLLPLPASKDGAPITLYTMGMNPDVLRQWNSYTVVSGDYDPAKGETMPPIPTETDYGIIRVTVSNDGARPDIIFGGANPEELDMLAFSDMAKAESWTISPALDDIQNVMKEIGAEKTILAIYFRQPYVLDNASGLKEAGAILATFGVRDAAIMDVLTGHFVASGKMPFALANNASAIVEQASDAPGYDAKDTLYPFGYGLSY